MQATRREVLSGGTLALLGGGFLSRLDTVAAMQTGGSNSMTNALGREATGTSEAQFVKPTPGGA